MVLANKVSRRLLMTFMTTTAAKTSRAYGLNNTDITAELFPTGGIKDDYERKFYIAGVTILTVFVLFMVYGALHEVDEDLIDYDGRRRRRKERKRLRRERRRLARPHPCEKRIYDVTTSANDLLQSMRSQYGCKCLCTCEVQVHVQIADPNQGSCQRQPLIPAEQLQEHSENNNCEARRLYQSSDPGKRPCHVHEVPVYDVWLKRQSYLQASNEFCIMDSNDEVFLLVGDRSGKLLEHTPDDTSGTAKTDFGGREKSSNAANLISFPSFDESPSRGSRVTSGDVTGSKPVTEECEDVWRRRSSLELQNIGTT